ncbi:MAG: alpha/beta fold hydrolase [Gemmatimonadota bacterium]
MTWVLLGALLLGWFVYRVRANRGLVRPPVLDEEGRPYDRFEVRLSDGSTIPLIDTGSGPAILLIPGADGMRETWRYQIPVLARRFRVLAPDLRTDIPDDATFDLFCRDAAEILDARGVPDAVVVGQSLGGAIALRFALLFPGRARGLVVANSLARVSYEHVGLNRTLLVPVAMATTRYLPTVPARWLARLWSRFEVWMFDRSPGSERVIDYALWTGPRTVPARESSARVDLLKGEDLRLRLAGIRAPTLVVKGPRDHYVPPAWSREIAGLIPGARYVEVPGTGHVSHISLPDTFNRIVLDWLDEIGVTADSTEADA